MSTTPTENTPDRPERPHDTGPQWHLDGLDPDRPFDATLVFTDGDLDVRVPLAPDLLAQLCPILNNIRDAQRAVILGEPAPDAATALALTEDIDITHGTPAKARKRPHPFLLALIAIVGLAALYSIITGAIYI